MQRFPRFALAAALAVCAAGCSPKPEPAEPAVTELDPEAASASFAEKIESHLESLDLARKATRALVRSTPGAEGEEIVYQFVGLGSQRDLDPILFRLGKKWTETSDVSAWMPWERLVDNNRLRPGPFMGTFRDEEFHITLWIDLYGTDLFVCYKSPPHTIPDEPAAKPGGPTEEGAAGH